VLSSAEQRLVWRPSIVAAQPSRIEEVAAMGKQTGERAVVLGASMAGLLAARVLADAYAQVTVVDRDELPEAVIGFGRRIRGLSCCAPAARFSRATSGPGFARCPM
jgi:threonine dehydrogenase-like Zn-dependent dehydrogenase